jgi:hypothetical protein
MQRIEAGQWAVTRDALLADAEAEIASGAYIGGRWRISPTAICEMDNVS